jgi:glycosyltransferase involved in cell wall biosynthesis
MALQSARSKLHIGIDCRFIQDKFHGIGRYAYHILSHLCALDGEHHITAFVDPSLPNSRFQLDTLVQSGRLTICPISIPLYHPRELWTWRSVLRKAVVDVFHSPYFWAPLRVGCPMVITIHDMIFDRYPEYMPRRHLALIYKVMTRLATRRACKVIAVSDATRQDIQAYTRVDAGKLCVIPEGVDRLFTPVSDPQALLDVRRRYGLPQQYVLALGARRPHKNIARLVAAFSRISAEIPHALVLVGAIDQRFPAEMSGAIDGLKAAGRIMEIGYVAEADLPMLYTMADLFAQPSIIEGFGLPVLEAMACGCPVACSNTSSLPEVAGDATLLFDPLSEAQIADTLRRGLSSQELRRELAGCGLRRAAEFTWEIAAERTLNVYYHAVRHKYE